MERRSGMRLLITVGICCVSSRTTRDSGTDYVIPTVYESLLHHLIICLWLMVEILPVDQEVTHRSTDYRSIFPCLTRFSSHIIIIGAVIIIIFPIISSCVSIIYYFPLLIITYVRWDYVKRLGNVNNIAFYD